LGPKMFNYVLKRENQHLQKISLTRMCTLS
jgi:hypothetical protein